jgi:hypothetical protein
MLRASAVIEFRRFVELLAPDTLEALVCLPIDVSIGSARLPQSMDARDMPRVTGGAHELVVRDIEEFARCSNLSAFELTNSPTGSPAASAGPHVLQTIVIGSALEPDVTSQKMVVACVGVSLDQLQRESDMGRRVDVGNRGRDVDDPTCSSAFPFEGSYAREAE